MTISPSIEAACKYECLTALLRRGVRAAIGHDLAATAEHILGAMRAAANFAYESQKQSHTSTAASWERKSAADDSQLAQLTADSRLHMTHVFNVCGFHHREPGLTNFGLLSRLPATVSD